MPSQTNPVQMDVWMESCHFPSLIDDEFASSEIGTCSSWLSFPDFLVQQYATEVLNPDNICKFAFILLLETYIRGDGVSCGVLDDVAGSWTSYILTASLDTSASLFENFQRTFAAASSCTIPTGAFYDMRTRTGYKPFNTTLCHIHHGTKTQQSINLFESDFVLSVEHGISETFPDKVKVILDYNTHFLDDWYAQNIISTYGSILSTMSASMNKPLAMVNLISARDVQQISTWNATLPSPARQTLNEHFSKIFHHYADKEAVYTSDGCFSYRELDDLSTILAARLIKLGLKPNMVVPICMDKSKWVTCAMTAVWKAGGALASLEPSHPDSRLIMMIQDLGAKMIISDPAHALRFQKLDLDIIADLEELPLIFEATNRPRSHPNAWYMGGVTPDDLAFVAFTSGSTGRPKGVMHTHNRLTSEHLSYGWNLEYTGEARILQFASYAYIAGVGENFRTLLHGSTLCIPSEIERTSDLAGFIARSRSTRSYMTPSLIRTIDPIAVPSLKHLVVGGEPIDHDLEEIWANHVHFIQLYGASEGGFMTKEPHGPHGRGKGFFPIGGISWLVDPQNTDKLVPIGAIGEIVFESHELAAGYWNDPEKTAETFIDPPLWAKERASAIGSRYLRMRDLGRLEKDGSMTILGRADTQIKIHGQRVELRDIEFNLRNLLPPKTNLVVELVRPFDAPDRAILTAFCETRSESGSGERKQAMSEAQAVFKHAQQGLSDVLPQHMIPRAFISLEQLPQNSSNKTDRRKLRDDASKLGYKHLTASSPSARNSKAGEDLSSETERILASLWADILGQDVNSIGPRDSFIALGGDSLAAIKLVSAARLEGLQLTTQKILLCRDLGELADGVTPVGTKSNGHEDSADLPPSTAIVTMKATDFQDWAARVGASNGGWIDHLVYDFFGQLDLNKIKKSCHELVQAHAILRTTFRINDEDDVVMDIAPKQDLTFTVHNVQIDELENKSIEVYHYARVSSLGKPIVRFDLIKVTQTRYRLILRLSHAQYDGFCTKTFSDHLRLLYLSQQIPLTCPFEAFVRHILDTRYIQEAEKYWKAQLENSTMPQLVQRTSQSKACFRENPLDAEVTMSLAEPNLRGNAITVAVMAKAAWGLTLCALTRSDDVVFGDFISGRQLTFDGNIGSVVGPCVNFIPLRMRLDTNTTNREFLLNMQEHCVRASAFESLGFKYIFRHCTHWNTKPRFSSIFNYANVGHGVEETEMWTASDKDASQALQVRSSYEEKQFDKTDLWLLCSPGVEAKDGVRRLKFHLRYSTGVYTASAVESIAAIYHNAFASLVVMDERVRNPTIGDVELDQLIPKL